MNEKIHKILDLCFKAEEKRHKAIFDYTSSIESVRIYIYHDEESENMNFDKQFNFYLDCDDADEKADEIIEYFENLIEGGKDGD